MPGARTREPASLRRSSAGAGAASCRGPRWRQRLSQRRLRRRAPRAVGSGRRGRRSCSRAESVVHCASLSPTDSRRVRPRRRDRAARHRAGRASARGARAMLARMPVLPRAAFVASSAGASTILARTALGHPPGWLELGTLFGWFALSTTGVFFPSLEMYGSIVSRGPQGRGQVALTFDDGPHPETTRAVLEALSGTAHRATFFVLGDKARRHPDVVREIHEAGHSLGVHGDFHDRLHSFRHPTRVRRELEAARASVERATGVRPRIFRPPLGHTTPLTVFGARRAGMTIVGWSARAYDG